jgi:hypothetical protein
MFGKVPKNSVPFIFNGIEYPSIAAAVRATNMSLHMMKKQGGNYGS